MKKLPLILVTALFIYGCGSSDYVPPSSMSRRRQAKAPPEIREPERYTYAGTRYRDPFARSRVSAYRADGDTTPALNVDGLRVTGYIKGRFEKFITVSGPGGSYVIKNGRVFDEEDQEIPGVAAVIRDEKVTLITGKDTVYELALP